LIFMLHASAIVLAAGEGRRIGGSTPKAYLPIAGRPLVLRTLDRVLSSAAIESVVLVVAAEQLERCKSMLQADVALRNRPWLLQPGGASRQESARLGLERSRSDTDIIVIHDAARPFVSAALIDRCVQAAALHKAVIVGLPVRDTIKSVSQRWVQATPERSAFWEIQTPQAFQRDLILRAHQQAVSDGVQGTDDAMLVERIGEPVYVLDGERTNFKITVPEDVWLAETLIREGRVP
jgi:2-C-methyl-D-erythritol 4-phosphate cytidylyltransferase